jgi:hypothetical protein
MQPLPPSPADRDDVDFIDEHGWNTPRPAGPAGGDGQPAGQELLGRGGRDDRDEAAVRAVIFELHGAGHLGEQRVVLAEADVLARRRTCGCALPDEDRTTRDGLPSNRFTPRRCDWLSRPLRELPWPFLCAIAQCS